MTRLRPLSSELLYCSPECIEDYLVPVPYPPAPPTVSSASDAESTPRTPRRAEPVWLSASTPAIAC